MRKSDADRLLAAMPPTKNLDQEDYKPRRNGGRSLSDQFIFDEAEDTISGIINNSKPSPLEQIAETFSHLTIEAFTQFRQEVSPRVADQILLWSLKKCQKKQVPQISMAALSAAIMSSGSENPTLAVAVVQPPEREPPQ